MAFFFSEVATQENSKPKRKLKAQGNEREQDSEESNDETVTSSQIASTNSQEWIEKHRTIIDRKLYPAISYWIALTTPNSAPANPIHSQFIKHSMMHECGVETLANQVGKIFYLDRITFLFLCVLYSYFLSRLTYDHFLFILFVFFR